MSYNNTFYLHFVTDLRRVVFCMTNGDLEGARAFLDHANSIYESRLRQIMDGESKELRFDELWLDIYKNKSALATINEKQIVEKLLTLSSMIFLRSTAVIPILPHTSKLAAKKAESAAHI